MLSWIQIFDFARSQLLIITLVVFTIGVMLRVTKWLSFGFRRHPGLKRSKPKSSRLRKVIESWSLDMIPPWDLSGRLAWAEDIAGITMHATCILILLGALHAASVLSILNIPHRPSTLRLPVIPASALPITIPKWLLTYIITPIFLATLGVLILRRAEHYLTGGPLKTITLRTDWIAAILLWLAGLTGLLAVLDFEPHTPILTVHLILTQLFIMYLPYSKLIHSASVFMVRTWTGLRRARLGV